jgi:tripartite ATP-independent transporter DctP family solute receptor
MKIRVLAVLMAFSLAAMVFAAGGTDAGGSAAAAQDAVLTLKVASSAPIIDPRSIAAQEFGKEIEAKTGGKLKVQLYHSGQLGSDAALIEALALNSGTVDMIISDTGNYATYVPKMGISALPFMFKDFATAWKFMDGEIQAEVEKELLSHNIRVLAHYDNGFRCVTTGSRVIKTPADMKNMLIRVPENPVYMATMRALGANPQPLGFAEVYMALRQGTFDAQENPIPVIYNNKFYEVQKHISITNHSYAGMAFAISETTWKKLSTSQQKTVTEAALNSAKGNRAMNKKMTEDFLSLLEKEGMTITQPDLPLFVEATKNVKNDFSKIYGEALLKKLENWLAANK